MNAKYRSIIFTLLLAAAFPHLSQAADLLPDLAMAQLKDFTIQNTANGRRLLRFTTIIVNIGAGPFELHGSRDSTLNPDMTVRQRVYNDTGGYRDVLTNAAIYYAGDGHNHWHVRDLETYQLKRLDNGVKVGVGAKHGFCFYDNTQHNLMLLGAPQAPVYTGCASNQPSALSVTMGLSVGWGDIYRYNLGEQYIDITGLGSGHYRLQATADLNNWFVERSNSNNTTWVDIQLHGNGSGIKIVGYGPSY